jgi:hypothetical protein
METWYIDVDSEIKVGVAKRDLSPSVHPSAGCADHAQCLTSRPCRCHVLQELATTLVNPTSMFYIIDDDTCSFYITHFIKGWPLM